MTAMRGASCCCSIFLRRAGEFARTWVFRGKSTAQALCGHRSSQKSFCVPAEKWCIARCLAFPSGGVLPGIRREAFLVPKMT